MNRAPLLLRWGLRHHLRQPLRSLLAVLGIALGVALFVGIQTALGNATAAFAAAATTLVGDATHAVRGGPEGVPTAVLAELATADGVTAAAPVSEGQARAMAGGHAHRIHWFGCDPLVDAAVRPAFGQRRAGDAGAALAAAGLGLLTAPGAFAATPATLARLGLAPGDHVSLWIGGRQFAARCAFALTGGAALQESLDDVFVVDIATAQEWSGRPDRVDRIDVVLAAGAVERLQARLGAAVRVVPVAGQAAFADLTAAFRTNLQALGLMALLVGAFLVHAAMRGAVASRTVEFALLRALGAPSRQLVLAVAKEAMVLGCLGSALGAGLGLGAAHLLVQPLVQTLNDHYAAFSLHGVRADPLLLALAVALGTAVAVAAAIDPARQAGRAPPRAVFARARLPSIAPPVSPWLVLPLAVGGAGALWLAGRRVVVAHAGMLALLLAVAAVVPRAIELLLVGTARVVGRAGPWLAYIARGAAASRHRTASASAALVLAVAMTTGLGMMIASFRGSVSLWLDQALPADVYVGVPGRFNERQAAVIEPAIAAALRAVPGHAAVSTFRRFQTDLRSGPGPLRATDVLVLEPTPRVLAQMPLLGDAATARAAFAAGAGALASEPLAFHLGLAVGDEVALATDRGPRTLPIVGIVRDYRSSTGELTVPRSWYGGDAVSALAFECAPGQAAEDLAARLRAALLPWPQSLDVDSQASIRQSTLRVFDRTFAITAALRLLCIGVAVLGIYGAFAALQHERRQEIGVLRALGAGPRHVALAVVGQTTLLGTWAGLLSLPVGAGIGYCLVHVVNRGSFGWTLLGVELPPRLCVEAVAMAVGAAFVAGLEPAWRMVRTAPAAALRED